MAYINHFAQQLIDTPPLNNALVQQYPFTQFLENTDEQLLQVLQRFILGQLNQKFPIQPLDFTKYTIQELCLQFHVPLTQFMPIFFFHHWGPHPQKNNKDMTQKWEDNTNMMDRCYWKKFRGSKSLRQGNAYVTTYHLYQGLNGQNDIPRGYSLLEYRFQHEFYIDQVQQPVDALRMKSDWALVKMIRTASG